MKRQTEVQLKVKEIHLVTKRSSRTQHTVHLKQTHLVPYLFLKQVTGSRCWILAGLEDSGNFSWSLGIYSVLFPLILESEGQRKNGENFEKK